MPQGFSSCSGWPVITRRPAGSDWTRTWVSRQNEKVKHKNIHLLKVHNSDPSRKLQVWACSKQNRCPILRHNRKFMRYLIKCSSITYSYITIDEQEMKTWCNTRHGEEQLLPFMCPCLSNCDYHLSWLTFSYDIAKQTQVSSSARLKNNLAN